VRSAYRFFFSKRDNLSDEAGSLFIQILDRTIEIRSGSTRGRALLLESYGHLQTSRKSPDLAYSIEDKSDSTLLIRRQAVEISVARPAHLLPLFDDDLVVQLQYLRPDLYFVHAAVVALEERAFLLPAPPGHGKSTLAWALLQHGLRYSSDELGPIDPKTLSVAPYSRAICLKKNPSPPTAPRRSSSEVTPPCTCRSSAFPYRPSIGAFLLPGSSFPAMTPMPIDPRSRESAPPPRQQGCTPTPSIHWLTQVVGWIPPWKSPRGSPLSS